MVTSEAAREYLEYLYPLVGAEDDRHKGLVSLMHDKEFVWFVPNDDNRIADGREIRFDWADENNADVGGSGATFLEVLIGISRHMAFLTSEDAEGWAWQLIVNLELDKMYDHLSSRAEQYIDEVLETCIWRTYKPNGQGGFFPLTHPTQNQTEVEIWYQMNAYVIEIES